MSKKLFQVVRRRAIAASSIFIVLSLMIAFRHPLFKYGVQTYFNMKCPVEGGWSFEYDEVSLSKKGFEIRDVSLDAGDTTFSFACDHVRLYAKHKVQAHFDLHLAMPEAVVTFREVDNATPVSPEILWDLLRMRAHLVMETGKIDLVAKEKSTSIYFSLYGEEGGTALGTFLLSQSRDLENEVEAMVKCYSWPSEKIIEFEADECDVSWLSDFITFFDIMDLSEWSIREGKLAGHLWLGWRNEKDLSQLTALLNLTEFEGSYEEHGLDISLPEIDFDLSFPSGKRLKEDIKWRPLQNLALKSQIREGKVGFRDPTRSTEFAICDIGGLVSLNSLKSSEIELKGFLEQKGHAAPIVISGTPSMIDPNSMAIDLKLLLESDHATQLGMSVTFEEEGSCLVKGKLKEISTEQVSMFQHIVSFAYPEVKDVELVEGRVTCEMSLRFGAGKLQKFYLDQLYCDNLQMYWRSKDMLAFCSQLGGSAQIDLNATPTYRVPNWAITMINGDFVWGRQDDPPLTFSDINLDMTMQNGQFDPSFVGLIYEGVEAQAELIGKITEPDVALKLNTDGERLLHLLQEERMYLPEFAHYQFEFDTRLTREKDGWDASGVMTMQNGHKDQAYYQFGLSDSITKFTSIDMPQIYHQCISSGHFFADAMSCDLSEFVKYLSGEEWALSGEVSLYGEFNDDFVTVDFKTPFYRFQSQYGDIEHHGKVLSGSIRYDIAKQEFQSHVPIDGGSYHEKWMDVLYGDIRADLFLDGSRLFLKDITTEVKGLVLGGDLSVNFADEKGPQLKIAVNHAVGTTRQLEEYAEHLPGIDFPTFPFDGQILGKDQTFNLTCPLGCEGLANWNMKFDVQHGNYAAPTGLKMTDLKFAVAFDSQDKELRISRLFAKAQGNGEWERFELSIPSFTYIAPTGCFDIRIGNSCIDHARFVGHFDSDLAMVELNKSKSHLFNKPFEAGKAKFDSKWQLNECNIGVGFSLGDISTWANLLKTVQIWDLPPFLAELSKKETKGDISTQLSLHDGNWEVELEASQLQLMQRSIDKLSFHGEKIGSTWRIGKCIADDVSMKGAMFQRDHLLEIDLIKIIHPKFRIEFQEGNIDLSRASMHLDLSQATLALNDFFPMSGKVSLAGGMDFEVFRKAPYFNFGAMLDVDIEQFTREQFAVSSNGSMQLTYAPLEGWNVIDSDLDIFSTEGTSLGKIHIPVATLFEDQNDLSVQNANLTLQSNALKRFIETSPMAKDLSVEDVPISTGDVTSCLLSVTLSKDDLFVEGAMPTSEYRWNGFTYPFKGIDFNYQIGKLDLGLHVPFSDQEFYVKAAIDLDHQLETHIAMWKMENGEILDRSKRALSMDCRLKDRDGFLIHRIDGNLLGCNFSFCPKPQMQDAYSTVLLGHMDFDAGKMGPLLSEELRAFTEKFQLRKGYSLQGELTLNKTDPFQSFFEGSLKGKDFDLLGYQLKSLLAKVHLDPKQVRVQHLKVSDDAATCDIEELDLCKGETGDWLLRMPELAVTDLRPSLLRKRHQAYQRIKPFHVKKMVFQDVSGNISDESTIVGKGTLSFVNTFKREHNLLDIPLEIISRIGLDPVLLIPIQGEMDYLLKGGKMVFTKLKNSFSESKRSYFYLWHKSESYVDFAGNLHIDVRMKQHVLFKITQLFILSIQGNLEKPSFSLK